MFSNARNLSIRDTAIHNAGRDIIINYIYTEPQPVRFAFCLLHLWMTYVDYR